MTWRQPLDRPASRLARVAGLVVVGLGLTLAAVFVLLPLIARSFVRVIELLLAGCVYLVCDDSQILYRFQHLLCPCRLLHDNAVYIGRCMCNACHNSLYLSQHIDHFGRLI